MKWTPLLPIASIVGLVLLKDGFSAAMSGTGPGSGLGLFGGAVVVLVLVAALWVILSGKYEDSDRKWAYGAVGSILGYVLGVAAEP